MPNRKIKAQIPKSNIRGAFNPATVNSENRTVDMVFTTADPVEMYSYDLGRFREILKMDKSSVDLSRFKSGAPLLNSHRRYDLKDQIGVVESVRLEGDELVGTVRFSKRDDVEPIFQDVKDGIITNGSIGYRVDEYRDITKDGEQMRTLEATKWSPHEMSLVTVPADKRAGTRNQESGRESGETYEIEIQLKGESMPDTKKTETAPAPKERIEGKTVDVENQIKAERERCAAITRATRQSGLPEKFSQELIEKGLPLDQALTKIIDAAAEIDEKKPATRSYGSVRVGEEQDERETRIEAASQAILHRVFPKDHELTEPARQFKNMGVLRMAEHFLELQGVRTNMLSKGQIADRTFSHSTSDFANVLANTMSKRLRKGYENSPQTFKEFGVETTLPDFKTHSVPALGDAPDLEQLGEGGEVKYGTIGDSKEEYALATYAKAISVTREVIVNDDLGAFLRLATAFGRAAADLETTTAINAIISNPAMGDGNNLFDNTNHLNNPSAAALSEANLSALKAAMRNQVNTQSRAMNIVPRFLMVGSELEDTALKLLADKNQSGGFNVHGGKFDLIVEPRLDATEYYIIADPMQVEGLEYAYLEGEQGLQISVERGFDVEGMKVKARLDFAAKAIDWRAFAKNAGA